MGKGAYTDNYKMSKAKYKAAKYYALQYEDWKKEVNKNPGSNEAGRLIEKIGIIERAVMEADADIYKYLLQGVIEENVSFTKLKMEGIPCGRNKYYDSRRKFYYLLSKQI